MCVPLVRGCVQRQSNRVVAQPCVCVSCTMYTQAIMLTAYAATVAIAHSLLGAAEELYQKIIYARISIILS